MLEGLDRVDWARLGHAYGSAVDVPDQIRALGSQDGDTRRDAMSALYSNIFHQGTRYEATAYAVPFLLELLGDTDTPDRQSLLALLASIAVGYDETWLPDGLPIVEHRRIAAGGRALLAAAPHPGDDDFDEDEGDYAYFESLTEDEQNRLETYVAVAAYDAVRVGVPLFRTLLRSSDLALATVAAYALAWFPEDAAGSVPALRELVASSLRRGDDAVALTGLVSMGLLDGKPPAELVRDARPLVRLGSAVALARIDGVRAHHTVVNELLAWTRSSAGVDPRFPFLDGDIAGYASMALRQAGPRHADAAFDALLERVPVVSGVEALPVVGEALRIAFPSGPLNQDTPFATLDERQRRLVRALADSPTTWQIDGVFFGNFLLLVDSYGLPPDVERLRAYIHDTS